MTSTRGDLVRCVVGDDDTLVRMVVRSALEDHGWLVVDAPSGHAVVAAAGSVDVAVIDARMPGLSLADTISGLRAERWIPVLVISGAEPEEGLPPDIDYLAKPFELDALLRSVDRLVERPADRVDS